MSCTKFDQVKLAVAFEVDWLTAGTRECQTAFEFAAWHSDTTQEDLWYVWLHDFTY